jgi:hypothetical protein
VALSPDYWKERMAEQFVAKGLPFDPRGMIQLNSGIYAEGTGAIAGKDLSTQAGFDYPNQVSIPIGKQSEAIHFLQSCRWDREPTGTEVAHYVIHFKDGDHVRVPIIYGEDTIEHGTRDFEGIETIAWQQEVSNNGGPGMTSLIQQTWKNPHPDKTITQIDFVSAQKMAAPFLVAITIE